METIDVSNIRPLSDLAEIVKFVAYDKPQAARKWTANIIFCFSYRRQSSIIQPINVNNSSHCLLYATGKTN